MEWFGASSAGTDPLLWLTVFVSVLTVAGIALFAFRNRWAWLPPAAGFLLFLALSSAAGPAQLGFGDLLLPAVCVYGFLRWQHARAANEGVLPLRRATPEEWGIGAGLLILFALIKGFSGLELLAVIGPELILNAVLSSLPLVVYLGLAHGIADAWTAGVAFGLLNLGNATAAGTPRIALVYAAAAVGLYVLGLIKWRTALEAQDRPRELASTASR
ncbi:nicotinamide mononucleotide transporter [Arthrobacter sp. USHLN218]|uniref:nicotinamide mononucleotide transporter n=1 Tax=Arthrobacter sp. USHLN218 TaxID=3081232 RepID=UPI003017211B